MERFYQFAGITLRVSGPNPQMYQDDGVLSAFAVPNQQPDYSLEIRLVDRLDEPEGTCVFQDRALRVYQCGEKQIRYEGTVSEGLERAYLRIAREGAFGIAQVKRQPDFAHISPKTVLNTVEAEHLIAQNRGFLLHASFINRNEKAILFTAPSGTGKSTQAALWSTLRGAQQINGDRAAVMLNADGRAIAAGIPFSGSSGVCENVTLPLDAVVYLTQAPETEITRLSGVEAFRRVWEGCCVNTWNRKDVDACTQAVMRVLTSVPVFHLACTPDESAVTALERALKELR